MKSIWKLIASFAIVGGLAACKKDKLPTDFSGGCEAVDLGLSVKWASYNVGAHDVYGHGSFFAWGETEEKENYGWFNEGEYKWGVLDSEDAPKYGMTKYTGDVEGGDGLKTLLPEDDPATVNWGTKWRTPTAMEVEELFDKANTEWTWDDEKKGYVVRSLKTGNSIFLPTAGYREGTDLLLVGEYGGFWSSSLVEDYPDEAHLFYIEGGSDNSYDKRFYGLSVRAVTKY